MFILSCLLLLVLLANLAFDIFLSTRRVSGEVVVVRGVQVHGPGRAKADLLALNVQKAYRSARRPAPPVLFVEDEVEMTIISPDCPPQRVVNRR